MHLLTSFFHCLSFRKLFGIGGLFLLSNLDSNGWDMLIKPYNFIILDKG